MPKVGQVSNASPNLGIGFSKWVDHRASKCSGLFTNLVGLVERCSSSNESALCLTSLGFIVPSNWSMFLLQKHTCGHETKC